MPVLVRLDEVLHERRMTLTELADKVGITIANLSSGDRQPVRNLTEALLARLRDLLAG